MFPSGENLIWKLRTAQFIMQTLAYFRNRKFITLPQESTTRPYLVADHFGPHPLGFGLPIAVLLTSFFKLEFCILFHVLVPIKLYFN